MIQTSEPVDLLDFRFIMNYIEQINNFWSYTEEEDITSSETSVYFALLKYNNSLNWVKTFRCDYAVICQYARVSKNTFYKSLDKLQDLKLIEYQKGERNRLKPKVTVLKLKNKKGTIKEHEGNNKGITEEQERNSKGTVKEHEGNLYKHINNKLLNLETIKLLNNKTYSKKINENLKKWLGLEEEITLDKSLLSEIDISDVPELELEYFKIAKAFQELFIKNLKEKNVPTKNQEKANYKNYVTPIRLMMLKDDVTKEQMTEVFDYLKSDRCENPNFSWKTNILSTSKLREKFTQLLLKSKEQNGKQTHKTKQVQYSEDFKRRIFEKLQS